MHDAIAWEMLLPDAWDSPSSDASCCLSACHVLPAEHGATRQTLHPFATSQVDLTASHRGIEVDEVVQRETASFRVPVQRHAKSTKCQGQTSADWSP